jgi:hypothetical protein
MHLNIFVVSQLVMVDQSGSKEVSVKWSCLMDWLCNSFYLLVQTIFALKNSSGTLNRISDKLFIIYHLFSFLTCHPPFFFYYKVKIGIDMELISILASTQKKIKVNIEVIGTANLLRSTTSFTNDTD